MIKQILLAAIILVSVTFNAVSETDKTVKDSIEVEAIAEENAIATEHPLKPLLDAIIYVESKGNPKAHNRNGDCVGLLQITKVCVRECNITLKRKGVSKRYSYSDRWDAEKSIEMFYILQERFNPTNDIVKGIRVWNKRPSYKAKILKIMKRKS